jgi:endonuclease-3
MGMAKLPFNIPVMFRRIDKAVRPFASAAMFELAEHGYRTPFQQLVGCMISTRTYDEVSLPLSLALLKKAPTPAAMRRLSVAEIDRLIGQATFHRTKAQWIHDMAERAETEFSGDIPCDPDVMQSFAGIGPKCANLAAGVACGAAEISVDVHVRRVTIRWGYVKEGSAEQVRRQLEQKLPPRYWIEINRLLVPFGKHVCTGQRPKCSTCPVLQYCRQVGVTTHR